MTVSIRIATANDASLIYQLIVELAEYEEARHCVNLTADDLRCQLSDEAPPFECLIAEVEGQPAGFALFFHAFSTWEGKTLYLEDLFVRPSYRKAGVGAALMSELASLANVRACKRFEWSVLDWNEPAINFYHRIGAKPLSGWTRYRMDGETLLSHSREMNSTLKVSA